MRKEIGYIGWNGKRQKAEVTHHLGLAIGTRNLAPQFSLRRFIWSAAFGYVNGYPVMAILYFCFTRTIHWRIFKWAMLREGQGWNDKYRMPTLDGGVAALIAEKASRELQGV